jgi:RNA polymerase sigma-70 factor (ECF subfamily)
MADEVQPSAEGDPQAAALSGELRGGLLTALGALREDDRLVLGCRFLLDLSEAETAAALDLRLGTVKSRTARALGRLRTQLEAADA